MTAAPSSLGAARRTDVYALPAHPAADLLDLQFGMRHHAIQTQPGGGPIFPAGWSTTDGSPMSVGVPALPFRSAREPGSVWLADALRTLEELDAEIAGATETRRKRSRGGPC